MKQTASYSIANKTIGRDRAAAIAKALEAIEFTHKTLTPALVVEAARDEASALHSWFEWDDERAAEKHRLEQARFLIRSVRVVYVGDDGQRTQPAKVYINLDDVDDQARAYVPVARVLSDPYLFNQAKQQFLKEAQAFEERYREFTALEALVKDMRARADKLSA